MRIAIWIGACSRGLTRASPSPCRCNFCNTGVTVFSGFTRGSWRRNWRINGIMNRYPSLSYGAFKTKQCLVELSFGTAKSRPDIFFVHHLHKPNSLADWRYQRKHFRDLVLIHRRKNDIIMGDKSPKSKQKNSSQKQAKDSRADAKKKQADAAKQVIAKKK